MSEHTKLPWRVGDLKQWSIETNVRPIIAEEKFAVAWAAGWAESDDKSVAAPEEAEANAALIVRAVNSLASNEAKIDALTKALEPFAKYEMLVIGDPLSLKKGDLKDCDYVVGFAGPVQPEFRHFINARAALSSHTEQGGGGRG
jgi:hypothetical protein